MPDIVEELTNAIVGSHRSVAEDHRLMRHAAKEIKDLRATVAILEEELKEERADNGQFGVGA